MNPSSYAKKRYIVFFIITVVVFFMPFINIENKHIFLLSFDKKQLHLFFTVFDMQELYLMPFILIFFFLSIFFMTTLGGRVWCGWACPQTIFRVLYRDLIQTKLLKIRKNISNKQSAPKSGFIGKKSLAVLIWSLLSLLAASNFMWYFVPPEDFFNYIKTPSEHLVLLGFITGITIFLIYNVLILKEDFCIHVCPYARVQSVMYDEDTIQSIYDEQRGGIIFDESGKKLHSKPTGEEDECTGCEACVRICPTHIDIRKGMQLECINCLECVDACVKVMNKLNKKTLISWTSPNAIVSKKSVNFIRPRTIGYVVVLTIALSLLVFMSGKKEHMLLNINRTTQLYKIKDDSIENLYTFLFQNTDNRDHYFYFEIDDKSIEIKQPKEPFLLEAGVKSKKIVILTKKRDLKTEEDLSIPITIKAFATDNKDEIFVTRDASFVYPGE